MRTGRVRLKAIGIGLAAALLALAVQLSGVLQPVELATTDLLMRARGSEPADPHVVICDIDASSIEKYGRWPWARTRVAELIDRLAAGGARVIAVDVLFAEPSRGDPKCNLAGEDEALARSIARARNVVLGFFFRSRLAKEPEAAVVPAALEGVPFQEVRAPARGFATIPVQQAAATNLELFARAADAQGFFSHARESGVLRHYQLVTGFAGAYYPALALRAVERFRGSPGLSLEAAPDGLPEIRIGGRRVASDERGALWVDYRGPARTFPTISAGKVLDGSAPAGAFHKRLVFVGASESGIADLQATPFGGEIAGVEVHANVAADLLGERGIQDSGLQALVSVLALLALGPLVALLVVGAERHLSGSLAALAVALLWPVVAYYAFTRPGWHLQVVSPAAAGVLALVGSLRYRMGYVEKQARQVKRTFQRYVSEAVVEEMLLHPERVKLGGERREMTVLFSDIRGFTSISEILDSEALVALLNEFFTPMTRIVLEHGGTLDKYMGDALMAFFGAPLAQPDHAASACRAALAMRDELARLNEGWLARGRLPSGQRLGIGIGLNSGEMSVGNIGSEAVFGYTVIGDNVNLGSRIEGLNKLYGTSVLVSAATVRACNGGVHGADRDRPGHQAGPANAGQAPRRAAPHTPAGDGELLFRELDRVQVKGKHEPVAIYELAGTLPAAAAERERLAAFATGLAAYRRADFATAAAFFAELVERTGDGPAAALLERCRHYLAHPPAEGWNGVEVLSAK